VPDETILAEEGLRAYAEHPLLRAVGVDRSYYGPLPSSTFSAFAAQVPDDFRFLVKAWQRLTQPGPGFLDPALAVDRCVAPAVEGLGTKLGVVLFQFPPLPPDVDLGGTRGPGPFAERLATFLAGMPRGVPVAVEVRTPAWMTGAYADVLVTHRARHSYVIHPSMPSIGEQMRRVPGGAREGVVIRWMLGHGQAYEEAKSRYAPFGRLAEPDLPSRRDVVRLSTLAVGKDKDVLVIVNNKAEGCAPLSVVEVASAISAGLAQTG
jgi:uncharacterized protein YecE (DUF72 family)